MNSEEILRQEILRNHKSVRAFSKKFNIPYPTMGNIFRNGIKGTGFSTILNICNCLDIDGETLLHESKIKYKNHDILLSLDEKTLINKYRALDERAKYMINYSVDAEYGYNSISKIKLDDIPQEKTNIISIKETSATLEDEEQCYEIPLLGATAAGTAISYGDTCEDSMHVSHIPNGADFALTVKGDSMEPQIQNGSIVFVHAQPHIECGEIGIVEIDGDEVTCKKIYFTEDNRLKLVSLNQNYAPMYPNEYRIIGKVLF